MAGKGRVDVEKLLRTPLEATWVVTSRCNLRCPYCLENAAFLDAPDDASEETRDLIVRELIANRILKACLSGGEPLLVPSVPDYVSRLRAAGMAVRLTTNGTLLDKRLADRLAASRLSAAEISLHAGAAEPVRRAVSLLVARDIPTLLRVVVTPANCAELEDVVDAFIGSGVEAIALQETSPLGRAALDAGKCVMDVDAMRTVRDRIDGIRERFGEDFVRFSSTTLAEAEAGQPLACTLDSRIRGGCEIRPDGNVIPCAPAVAYGVRNLISKKGLAACWRDMPRLYARFVEACPGGRCAECSSVQACGGGCRAVSYLLTGRTSGGNPICPFFRPLLTAEVAAAH